jgi:hypothetical protein
MAKVPLFLGEGEGGAQVKKIFFAEPKKASTFMQRRNKYESNWLNTEGVSLVGESR